MFMSLDSMQFATDSTELEALERNIITKPVNINELRNAFEPLNEYTKTINSNLNAMSREFDQDQDAVNDRFLFDNYQKFLPDATKKRKLYEYIKEVQKRRPSKTTTPDAYVKRQSLCRKLLQGFKMIPSYKFHFVQIDKYGDIIEPMRAMVKLSVII